VDKALVKKTNDHARLAGHCSMNRMPREEIAKKSVFTVRWATANLIARIGSSDRFVGA